MAYVNLKENFFTVKVHYDDGGVMVEVFRGGSLTPTVRGFTTYKIEQVGNITRQIETREQAARRAISIIRQNFRDNRK